MNDEKFDELLCSIRLLSLNQVNILKKHIDEKFFLSSVPVNILDVKELSFLYEVFKFKNEV